MNKYANNLFFWEKTEQIKKDFCDMDEKQNKAKDCENMTKAEQNNENKNNENKNSTYNIDKQSIEKLIKDIKQEKHRFNKYFLIISNQENLFETRGVIPYLDQPLTHIVQLYLQLKQKDAKKIQKHFNHITDTVVTICENPYVIVTNKKIIQNNIIPINHFSMSYVYFNENVYKDTTKITPNLLNEYTPNSAYFYLLFINWIQKLQSHLIQIWKKNPRLSYTKQQKILMLDLPTQILQKYINDTELLNNTTLFIDLDTLQLCNEYVASEIYQVIFNDILPKF